MATKTTNLNARTLGILRLALLLGILTIGGVFWFLASSGQAEGALDEAAFEVMQLVFVALLAAEGAALYVIKKKWEAAPTLQAKATFNIIGWALGEGLALFGAVMILLSGGQVLFYLGGLLFFALAWLMFPIPEADGRRM